MKAVGKILLARSLEEAQVVVHHLYTLMLNETRAPETNESVKFFLNQSSDDDIISEVTGETVILHHEIGEKLLLSSPYYSHFKVRLFQQGMRKKNE